MENRIGISRNDMQMLTNIEHRGRIPLPISVEVGEVNSLAKPNREIVSFRSCVRRAGGQSCVV